MPLSDHYPELQGWKPVESIPTALPQMPTPEVQVSPFLRTVLPLPLQYPGDTIKQYNRPGLSSFRFAPLPPGGIPAINSASQSVVNTVIKNNGQGVLLETDNVPNPSQSVLNIIPGSNIQVVSDSSGGVTITGTAGGDSLTHGDPVWEYDSAYSILRDDFAISTSSTNPIGDSGYWKEGGTGSPTISNYGGAFPYFGQVQIYPGSISADATAFIAPGNALGTAVTRSVWDFAWPLLDFPGWKMTWVFALRLPDPDNGGTLQTFNTSRLSMYIGLGNAGGAVGAGFTPGARPNVFFGCRFDTDTSAPSIGDTTFHLEACTNAINTSVPTTRYNNQGTLGGVFDTTIVPVNGAMHRLEIIYETLGTIIMTFDGVSTSFAVSPLVTSLPNNSINTGAGMSRMPTTISGGFTNTNGYNGAGAGSLVTFAGGSLQLPYVGTFPVLQNEGGTFIVINTPLGGVSGVTGAFTMAGYPGLFPIASIGVDSTGVGPGVFTRSLAVDYFSFVWNKGLATGGGTPIATNPRYW